MKGRMAQPICDGGTDVLERFAPLTNAAVAVEREQLRAAAAKSNEGYA